MECFIAVSSDILIYRVFDNDLKKVGAYFIDQTSSLELMTGVKISLSPASFLQIYV